MKQKGLKKKHSSSKSPQIQKSEKKNLKKNEESSKILILMLKTSLNMIRKKIKTKRFVYVFIS